MERFLAEGVLPNFGELVRRGCFTRIRPVIPAQTPANWNTIATGATPGTHGIIQWGTHIPGEPVWERHDADAFAAKHSDASKLASGLVKMYEDNASTLTPDPLHSAFHDSHPPPSLRLKHLRGL